MNLRQLEPMDFSAEYRMPAHGPATGKLATRANIDDLIKSPVSTRMGADQSTTHVASGAASFSNVNAAANANLDRKP